MKSKTRRSSKWKSIIIHDKNGEELQKIELDDNQKQTTIKTRNRRRKFDKPKTNNKVDPKAIKNEIPQPQAPKYQFNFQQTIIFSRESGESEENNLENDLFSYLFENSSHACSNGNQDVSEISFNDFSIEGCYSSSSYISNNSNNNDDVQVNFYFMDDKDIDDI